VTEIPYSRLPVDFSTPISYRYGPDSERQPGVPEGTVREYKLASSEGFPGTTRRYWAYVPANYDESVPAAVMVFQDGHVYLDPDGIFRAGIVFDNLIHRGEMPTTIGVFVDPGEPGNRNAEYDAFDDRYANFLLSEILPNVQADYAITDDPNLWAIGGGSSGGNCSLTAAWHRPDRFRRVMSAQGSFVQIPGGNPYPQLIETTPPLPLRIFLCAESRDLYFNEREFNWFSSNLRIAAALAEQGYDVRLVVGDAEHTLRPGGNHGAVILPDALRWLWAQPAGTSA
jgi:enterochelin esterase family protein